MSKYIKTLVADYNVDDLEYIKNFALSFHYKNKQDILNVFDYGTTPIRPEIGYYIPLFGNTFEEKQQSIKSWSDANFIETENFNVNTIKMNQGNNTYQILHTISPKNYFTDEFFTVLTRILSHIPVKFDLRSPTLSMQEFGYSMKFHYDAGVQSRIHINLNKDCLDFFYTDDGTHRVDHAECFLIEASKTNHGFMSFQKEPRIHIMMDIL